MFSISAINDREAKDQWEPLAPTKEAQEFHLSQIYHEGLLKLQAKEYAKACELLEAVLRDPLITSAQVDNSASDGHLLQLRFLALKNLASVFLQQGSMHFDSALRCYLQAVEIDTKDSVVWNQLGTLSCSMGLLSISRWAFEQGLFCSPNNWNCMEKLLEVLIAIGDEVACLSVAELILRHWPSHSRALHVKNTIEESEPVPFAPRGIDTLEPKHVRLKFPDKRKATDENIDEGIQLKRQNQNIDLHLTEASWTALADALLGILRPVSVCGSEQNPGQNQSDLLNDNHDYRHAGIPIISEDVHRGNISPLASERGNYNEKLHRCGDIRLSLHFPSAAKNVMVSAERKGINVTKAGETMTLGDCHTEKVSMIKEKEASIYDEQHPQERRSTRLERLRSRKPGKEELDFATSKNLAKVVIQFLEPFIVGRLRTEDSEDATGCSVPCSDVLENPLDTEHNDITTFVVETSNNFGAYHMCHLLLEEVSRRGLPYQDAFIKFLELERLTRQWGQDRTPECSLFLAELYYDIGSCSIEESKQQEFMSEASFHLCKVIELVALDYPLQFSGELNSDSDSRIIKDTGDLSKPINLDSLSGNENCSSLNSSQDNGLLSAENLLCQLSLQENSILTKKSSLWVRFFWLSGRLSILDGDKAKAYQEFCISLSLLSCKRDTPLCFVSLTHCKLIKELTFERVLHEINLLKVDILLKKTVGDLFENEMYTECVNLLAPLLLSTKDVYLDLLPGAYKEGQVVTSLELVALDFLITACEKTEPMDIKVYLNCHRRKLQVLTVLAGMVECPASHKTFYKKTLTKTQPTPDVEAAESTWKHWSHLVLEEVKAIMQSASRVKDIIIQPGNANCSSIPVSTIGDVQSLLLTVMCNIVSIFLCKKSSALGNADTEELESRCFVDAAIAFCKLQHLSQTVPVKTQVELIVAIHDLLAEYGLCCAGKDSEGKEGTFLELAIKHLLALDMKLKLSCHSSNMGLEVAECDVQHSHYSQVKTSIDELKLNSLSVETAGAEKDGASLGEEVALEGTNCESSFSHQSLDKDDGGLKCGSHDYDGKSNPLEGEIESGNQLIEAENDKVELGIDNALDQSFFCLYGLNLRSDSSCEDDVAVHKNTNRGDYQTKEQCADVFQYILPYAKASSRTGLVKLRRVLRAIRKHFPQPPEDVLTGNSINKFLDDPDLCEDKLSEEAGSDGFLESILNIIFPNGRSLKQSKPLSVESSEPYLEVYSSLYYFLAQAEEMCATDKWPGFVLTKEGEEFVEQNANLFKYDLLYNPLRFESWQRLANIYDEEVDLLLNDGSKHINVKGWRKNANLPQRVETSRRRSRRCLLMSLALAKTSIQQGEIHELLALVYYDGLQNVVPIYDQRSVVPSKDAAWMMFCQNSMKHFEKAFAHKQDWSHAFYMGKLCEKLEHSPWNSFSYYDKAITLNPSAVDPVYRLHASRLKLLCSCGKQNLEALQVVAAYSFSQSEKEAVMNIFGWTSLVFSQFPKDVKDGNGQANSEKTVESDHFEEAWHMLYNDCVSALKICVEGDLKHFHKARYMLAHALYNRGESGDLEQAKEELSFCFKSYRSSFTINMWEIDGMVKKGRRKTPGLAGNKKALEVNLPESSRKFITCIRKYILFYSKLLQETGDICTLERAYTSLRADKRFSLCLEDLVPVALGRYIMALISSIHQAENLGPGVVSSSVEHQLEKMFNLFMDQGNLWTEIGNLPEMKNPELSESILYSYLHLYIQSLERDVKLETLEGINEKIRKRLKNLKWSNSNCAKVCRHASVAWCRSIVVSLARITPLNTELSGGTQLPNQAGGNSETSLLLCVDLEANELWDSLSEDLTYLKGLETKWSELSKIKSIIIKQASEENMETANNLLRCSYNFYRDSSCGTLPSGINLYTVPSQLATETQIRPGMDGVNVLDLSIPRKLLLWAYTLVHGCYANILAVVKHCEENAKSKIKKAAGMPSTASHTGIPSSIHTNSENLTTVIGGARDRVGHDGYGEADSNSLTAVSSVSLPEGDSSLGPNVFSYLTETQKISFTALQLHQCNNAATERSTADMHDGGDDGRG